MIENYFYTKRWIIFISDVTSIVILYLLKLLHITALRILKLVCKLLICQLLHFFDMSLKPLGNV